MLNSIDDTIAAISTPQGEGGIAVVRITGLKALDIADTIFRGSITPSESRTHTINFGKIVHPQTHNIIDEVLLSIMKKPNSYTKEDTVEISCHGGIYTTQKILETVLNEGARMAEPGEFTQRAFLNGRIDLLQAEAVADLIKSKTEKSAKSSLEQLEGVLSDKIREIRHQMIEILSLLELELDFIEEDVEFVAKTDISSKINEVVCIFDELIDSFNYGKIYRDGAKLAIVGRPNVGKSSTLNMLLKEDRAIVSNIAGTTRDAIEDMLNIDGYLFKVIDTAGLRKSEDIIEAEGVRRTKKHIQKADIVLFILDISEGVTKEDIDILKNIILKEDNFGLVFGFNKIDLSKGIEIDIREIERLVENLITVSFSAKTSQGFNKLNQALISELWRGREPKTDSVIVTNVRHKDALQKSKDHLILAKESLIKGESNEFITLDLRESLNYMGDIIGETTTEDILDKIFSTFCIGK